jgi:uncharacterized protein with GYD domain
MSKVSLSPDAWAALIESPQDRRDPVSAAAESVGGKLLGYWYAFGDGDGYALFEAPDNVSVAALLTSVVATGAVKLSTTPLMTVEEMLEALGKAKSAKYSPPGS